MLNDPFTSLAISMQANPGIYAVLLGSGISRAAGIPTGWEIVTDLVRRLAAIEGAEFDGDPVAWYNERFGQDPDYSDLLKAIGKTPAERQHLLRAYFEPNEDEREQGLKQPTKAHRALAKLVAHGYVRVLLTTNFDRLLEQSLTDEGVSPTVISTPDGIQGALPLVHQNCCVFKLHGDYLDARIKNTSTELTSYDAETNQLLDRILDEFGLVVCGWSGDWDDALRAAIERCATRRFSFYWASRGKPKATAQRLIEARGGQVLSVADADSFFDKLAQNVLALEESRAPNFAGTEMAVALTKRFLSVPEHSIRLYEHVANIVDETYRAIEDRNNEFLQDNCREPEVYFRDVRDVSDRCLQVFVALVGFAKAEHYPLIIEMVERFCRPPKFVSGTMLNDEVRQYAAVLICTIAGLTAVIRKNYGLLGELLFRPRGTDYLRRRNEPLLAIINWNELSQYIKLQKRYSQRHVPLSEHLFESLRPLVLQFAPSDDAYDDAFDCYEYLRALAYVDQACSDLSGDRVYAPWGRYCWKTTNRTGTLAIAEQVESLDEDSPLLTAGLFGGSAQRLKDVKGALDQTIPKLGFY